MNLPTIIELIRHVAAGLYMIVQLNPPAWRRAFLQVPSLSSNLREPYAVIPENIQDLSVTTEHQTAAMEFGATDASRSRDSSVLAHDRQPHPCTDEPSVHPWHHTSIDSCIMGIHFQVKAGIQSRVLLDFLGSRFRGNDGCQNAPAKQGASLRSQNRTVHFVAHRALLLTTAIFLALVVLGSSGNSFAAERASHQPCPRYSLPPLVLEKPFVFAGEPIPVHRADVRARVVGQLNFLLLDARGVLTEWLSEKARYSWIFEEILAKEGVPSEFMLLSPVLYGLTRNSSRTAPVGWWALDKPCEPSEGVELSADSWHDDRLDYELATRCFAARIKRIRSELADTGWLLTAAAYVTSTKTIQELMQRWNTRSYWDLPLPDNAEELVVRWIALSIISAHREAYGLRFKETPPLMFDQVTALIFTKDLAVSQVAAMAGVSAREFLEMNPKIKSASGLFPAKDRGKSVTHTIAVPKGKGWAVVNKLRADGYLASTEKPK